MNGMAVYYPWINFREEGWVKASLLYWQQLVRIVPSSYSVLPSPFVRELEAEDLVASLDPAPSRQRVAAKLAAVIVSNGEALRARYRLPGTASVLGQPRDAVGQFDNGTTHLHADKLSAELINALREAHLAIWDPTGWVEVHRDIARVYMGAMAEDLGRDAGLSPLTDDPLSHVAVGGWSVDRMAQALLGLAAVGVAPADEDVTSKLAFVALRAVVPTGLESVDIETLVKVRRDYGEELTRFRNELASIVVQAGLAGIEHPEAFELHLSELHRQHIEPQLAGLRRDLKLLKVETVDSLMNVKVTLPAAAAIGAEHAHFGGAGATAGAAVIGLVGLRNSLAVDAAEKLQRSPAAYLLRVEDDLAVHGAAARVGRAARRMVLGL